METNRLWVALSQAALETTFGHSSDVPTEVMIAVRSDFRSELGTSIVTAGTCAYTQIISDVCSHCLRYKKGTPQTSHVKSELVRPHSTEADSANSMLCVSSVQSVVTLTLLYFAFNHFAGQYLQRSRRNLSWSCDKILRSDARGAQRLPSKAFYATTHLLCHRYLLYLMVTSHEFSTVPGLALAQSRTSVASERSGNGGILWCWGLGNASGAFCFASSTATLQRTRSAEWIILWDMTSLMILIYWVHQYTELYRVLYCILLFLCRYFLSQQLMVLCSGLGATRI